MKHTEVFWQTLIQVKLFEDCSSQGFKEYKTNVEFFDFVGIFFLSSIFLSSTLNFIEELLFYIISAHNCSEVEKLLLLSLVGHTGWAAGPRYLI